MRIGPKKRYRNELPYTEIVKSTTIIDSPLNARFYEIPTQLNMMSAYLSEPIATSISVWESSGMVESWRSFASRGLIKSTVDTSACL